MSLANKGSEGLEGLMLVPRRMGGPGEDLMRSPGNPTPGPRMSQCTASLITFSVMKSKYVIFIIKPGMTGCLPTGRVAHESHFLLPNP